MDIRKIEKIIDVFHENHPAFSGTKEQLFFELLSTFEDMCSHSIMRSMLNPSALGEITDNMDALNQALQWVNKSDLPPITAQINRNISKERYAQCVSLLNDYAYPYSLICSGYISYSRKRLLAEVNENTVTFNLAEDQNASTWSDIIRETRQFTFIDFMDRVNLYKISNTIDVLHRVVSVKDGILCYQLTKDIIDSFLTVSTAQWDCTKSLPESWKFDSFSLADYKRVWTCITAFCYIHLFACITISDSDVRLRNSTIIMPLNRIIDIVVAQSGLQKDIVEIIVKYITFDPSKRNMDIMYQPIVVLNNEMAIIAPMLFVASNPERNLLAVVSSKNDDLEHSKEVNDLEDLMVQEIEGVIPKTASLKTAKHKKLNSTLPDVDFGLLDIDSCAALLCELKWFAAADSTKEVYAREDDITHGCEQSEAVITYAMRDRKRFIKQVFGCDGGENVDIFCCVVAKHNIRTQHKYVPVIDLKKFKELLISKPINNVFHCIRNHEYEYTLPEGATITHRTIKYGDFTFKIPAICFESVPFDFDE